MLKVVVNVVLDGVGIGVWVLVVVVLGWGMLMGVILVILKFSMVGREVILYIWVWIVKIDF